MKNFLTSFVNTNGVAFPNTASVNSSGAGATNGTEIVKILVDDIWGFFQGLLNYTGDTPNDTSEIGASQLLNSLKVITTNNIITGLTLENDTDTEHDIKFNIGKCNDSTNAYFFDLTSAMVKRIDAGWAAGTGNGGLFSGSVGNNTWYYCFLIRKDSDGSLDAGFDTSKTAANKPAGYTAYRRIGAILTDGSANIRNFKQVGNKFIFNNRISNVAIGAIPNTNRILTTVSAPSNMICDVGLYLSTGATGMAYRIGNTIETDVDPGTGDSPFGISSNTIQSYSIDLLADNSSQIYFRTNTIANAPNYAIMTFGFYDNRLD